MFSAVELGCLTFILNTKHDDPIHFLLTVGPWRTTAGGWVRGTEGVTLRGDSSDTERRVFIVCGV